MSEFPPCVDCGEPDSGSCPGDRCRDCDVAHVLQGQYDAVLNAASDSPPPDLGCAHAKCVPAFDAEAAKGLDEIEVQRRWPRFWGVCPDCGCNVIAYASAEHYIAGDW